MRIAVTGAGGMLATALLPRMRERGHEVIGLTRDELDVTDGETVHERLAADRPEVVVQCAAYTAVDRAESDEAGAHHVNAVGAAHVAEACQAIGARFVYPSTDYVFPGNSEHPYRPDDPTDPLNAYGRTKRAGELAALWLEKALIVRTSWLYGAGGANFVDTIARLAGERPSLEVVDDQLGRPTWTGSLARVMTDLIEEQANGIFHATDGGAPVTWYGLAKEIAERMRADVEIVPVASSAYARAAPRPAYSVLDCRETEEILGYGLPDWRVSLAEYLGRADA